MLAEKNSYIGSAYRQLQVISQDKQKRLEYEAREKAVRDYNQGMYEAEQRGIERMRKLQDLLIQSKRYDDLARSATDDGYLEELFRKYGI